MEVRKNLSLSKIIGGGHPAPPYPFILQNCVNGIYRCIIKIFMGAGVVDGEGVAVKDARSGVVGVGGH